MSWLFNDKRRIVCGVLAALCLSQPAAAQIIDEERPLSFGSIAIVSTSSVARITVEPDGSYTTNSNLYVVTPPVLGEYHLSGAAVSSLYTVTTPISVDLVGPDGAYFTLDNFVVRPMTLSTDASGNDIFYLSGRLQTQGGGMIYEDGPYVGSITMTVDF